MLIESPCTSTSTSHLCCGVRFQRGKQHMEVSLRRADQGNGIWEYWIDGNDPHAAYHANDLYGPRIETAGRPTTDRSMLGDLLGFMSAASGQDDIFPPDVTAAWANEIEVAREAIEEDQHA